MNKYKRLKKIASLIKENERVLDVGTDHAYIPIFLLENKITDNIDASDINEHPLNTAKNNLKSKGYEDKVGLFLTNGLNGFNLNNYDVIIIAGMGGQTISNILKSKNFNGRYIIHSTTSVPSVRKTIQDIGLNITKEHLVIEGKIYNIIIEAIPGNMNLSDKELFMGPSLLKQDGNDVNNYYEFIFNTLEKNAFQSNNENFKIKERNWLREKIWSE